MLKSNFMNVFNPILTDYIKRLLSDNELDRKRMELLDKLSDYIKEKILQEKEVNLIFICTHNSRRSHLAHVWALVASKWYQLNNINFFSGGTEESAFNPRAVAALIRAGFKIENMNSITDHNPHYKLKFSEKEPEIILFSKLYNHKANPKENFAAIMVCSHADENCPFIPGAEKRFSIPYDDPKDFDNTELESEKYDERCFEIAKEMFYVFKKIKLN